MLSVNVLLRNIIRCSTSIRTVGPPFLALSRLFSLLSLPRRVASCNSPSLAPRLSGLFAHLSGSHWSLVHNLLLYVHPSQLLTIRMPMRKLCSKRPIASAHCMCASSIGRSHQGCGFAGKPSRSVLLACRLLLVQPALQAEASLTKLFVLRLVAVYVRSHRARVACALCCTAYIYHCAGVFMPSAHKRFSSIGSKIK